MENGKNGNGNGAPHPGMAVPVAPEVAPVEGGEVQGHEVMPAPAAVLPEVTPAEVAAVRDRMEEIKANLLTEKDYERAGKFTVVKSSGYSKIATFCGLSEELISMEIETNDAGRIVKAMAHVRVRHPNGRSVDGYGVAVPNKNMTNPDHDTPATAMTRARKRAIGPMVGGIDPDAGRAQGGQQRQPQRQQGRPVQQARQQTQRQQAPHPYAPRGQATRR